MEKDKLTKFRLNKKTISKLDALQQRGGNNVESLAKPCILTLDVNGINICFETQAYKTCGESIFIDCITQTELPTCRDCV
ncbi:hypothetical protein [Kordia sp.]|uniref:hypothetical protein n=1 Tax=Kordia sp. TaxID=1965332 RepID=UPI0025C4C1E3|nr:hypothetical protein [Kordia sp.]MCH2196144.1 hypothetical protein [Kordia sp.]